MALRFLETEDNLERVVITAVANKALEIRRIMMHNQAIEIANAVGQLFKK